MCGQRIGALEVIETVRTRDHIQRELQQLDSRLFIERQVTSCDRMPVWCVCMTLQVDGQQAVYALHEHRDGNGTPIGYPTSAMVEEIKRMMKRGAIRPADLDARNHERRETRRRAVYDRIREMAKDHGRFAGRQTQALYGGSPGVLASRREKRSSGHWERAEGARLVTSRPSVVRKG